MKKYTFLFVSVMYFVFVGNSMAAFFDGKREGWTLGLGVGGSSITAKDPMQTKKENSLMISASISYAFNDSFQIGFGKKVLGYKFNNKSVFNEVGGVVVDIFMDDYYITMGAGQSDAAYDFSKIEFSNSGYFIGLGHELSEGVNVEFVTGNTKFDRNTSVVTAEKVNFFGILLTTYIY